jgi:hypothetical protein
VLTSSALIGWVDENTTKVPDPLIAGATLGVHHSRPDEPLIRVTQCVIRSSKYTSGSRFLSDATGGHPGPDPRFEASD